MCGIAGIAGRRVPHERLQEVVAQMRHRGPDGNGAFQDGDVSLLHTRLTVIDLSEAGRQPMVDASTGVALVFNGEIYNYKALRDAYPEEIYSSQSDTEVLLRLYLRMGLRCLDELRGMFAFAIWDPRSRELHMARDRFGIKPLYYHLEEGVLSFGSEVKAILAMGTPCKLNQLTVFDFLCHGLLAHTPDTFFEHVQALEPGTVLTFVDGAVSKTSYWSPYKAVSEKAFDGDAEETLWGLLCDDMKHHMVSDVPVGVSLSSGLDSQFLLHLLAAIGVSNIKTFTYGFEDASYDEVVRLNSVEFPLNVERHSLRLHPGDVISDLRKALRFFEVPIGGLGTLGSYRVMELASREGVKVMLAGEGSDEIFAGYRYYNYAYFRDLYESGQHDLLTQELAGYNRIHGEALEPGSAEFIERVLGSGDKVWAPDSTAVTVDGLIGPALAGFDPSASWARSRSWHRPIPHDISHLRQSMIRDLHVQKIPKLLSFQDRAAMAWGVETRVPFLDHVLFEFMRSLPPEYLIRDGVSKYLLKRLYDRYCNLDYSGVRKHFVSTPQRKWIKGPLYDDIMELLGQGRLRELGLIDFPIFKKAYDAYSQSTELGNSFFVWKVLNLELLVQEFFTADGQAAPCSTVH